MSVSLCACVPVCVCMSLCVCLFVCVPVCGGGGSVGRSLCGSVCASVLFMCASLQTFAIAQ